MANAMESMEARLQGLINENSPENRKKWALKAKGQGKKVIGLLCSYVPPELIYAADMFPWRVTGTWTSDLSKALSYLSPDSCRYCSHVLESLLRGDLEFLDCLLVVDLFSQQVCGNYIRRAIVHNIVAQGPDRSQM